MTIRLKLVCHAPTSAIRTSAFPADEPLDAQGLQKLAGFSARLGHVDRCWTSPALRAVQTAAALHFDAVTEPLLRDCDYGTWTGRTLEDVQAHEPDAVVEWLGDPEAAPHGGESMAGLLKRAAMWLDAQSGAEGKVVAVTHAAVIRAAVLHAIKATPPSFWRIDVAPLSVTTLSGQHGRWTLSSLGIVQADAG